MRFRTTRKITIAEAKEFEDVQGAKGNMKQNILSHEDCFWELLFDKHTIGNGLKAEFTWFQVQEYQSDEEPPVTREKNCIMFYDPNFTLTKEEVNTLFNAIGVSIIPPTDYDAAQLAIIQQGVLIYLANKGYFGLTTGGFEAL